jgi:hypothetical protein
MEVGENCESTDFCSNPERDEASFVIYPQWSLLPLGELRIPKMDHEETDLARYMPAALVGCFGTQTHSQPIP